MGKRVKKPEAGAPLWMCTFGDLMSLLLCFFIMLFAISIIAEPRVEALVDTLRQDFYGYSGAGKTITRDPRTIAVPADSAARSRRVAALTGGQPTPGPLGQSTDVHVRPLDGVTVRVIRFELGRYDLTEQTPWAEQARWDLRNILPDLQGSPQKIMVKGYTAPIEAGGTFEGNQLAFSRALSVVDYLVSLGLQQGFFEIAFEPGASPSSLPSGTAPEHAGATVEILLLNQTLRELRQ